MENLVWQEAKYRQLDIFTHQLLPGDAVILAMPPSFRYSFEPWLLAAMESSQALACIWLSRSNFTLASLGCTSIPCRAALEGAVNPLQFPNTSV